MELVGLQELNGCFGSAEKSCLQESVIVLISFDTQEDFIRHSPFTLWHFCVCFIFITKTLHSLYIRTILNLEIFQIETRF